MNTFSVVQREYKYKLLRTDVQRLTAMFFTALENI